jgi:hypothetical protein
VLWGSTVGPIALEITSIAFDPAGRLGLVASLDGDVLLLQLEP